MYKQFRLSWVMEFLLFCGLFLLILIANSSILASDMMYIEQPTIYTANQLIGSLGNLVNVYLHPKFLHWAIPFFRPSGHFLIYQLLAPIVGWHNNAAFLGINFLFLALTGWVTIKIYRLLFPGYMMGGYLAVAIYAMHPALFMSRFTVMHFEFAYIFFSMVSFYYFILFCKTRAAKGFANYGLLAASLLSYIFAVTFKEPALMLVPMLTMYLLLTFYKPQPLSGLLSHCYHNKETCTIFLLLFFSMVTLALYITMPWGGLSNPVRPAAYVDSLGAFLTFLGHLLALPLDFAKSLQLHSVSLIWQRVTYPGVAQSVLMVINLMTLAGICLIVRNTDRNLFEHKKSLVVLAAGLLGFLFLPVAWGFGMPWHLSPSLLCLAIISGFACEYIVSVASDSFYVRRLTMGMAALLLLSLSVPVNDINLRDYEALRLQKDSPSLAFYYRLNNHALALSLPVEDKLNAQSLLLIEDRHGHGHMIGNGLYPFSEVYSESIFKLVTRRKDIFFMPSGPHYNGNLFRYAWLKPDIQEEIYPFDADRLNDVPDIVIHYWLQNYANIICLGYDDHANWQDRTAVFRKNLLEEQKSRKINVAEYNMYPAAMLGGISLNVENLPYPDPQLCQYNCDQSLVCKGFEFIHTEFHKRNIIQCQYFASVEMSNEFCSACLGYVKKAI